MSPGIFSKTVLLAALATPTTGCLLYTDSEPPGPGPGTLTVAFTIVGATNPSNCGYYRVNQVELTVYSPTGAVITQAYQACTDFHVSTRLYAGTYNADVTLVDAWNRARSITKPLNAIQVVADTELVIDVEFPPDSML